MWKLSLPCLLFFVFHVAMAGDFGGHRRTVKKIETQIQALSDELDKKVAAKNTTRDRAQMDDVLQRIVDIHSELISLRRDLDEEIEHIRDEHKELGEKANMFGAVKDRLAVEKRRQMVDPLQLQLDEMLRKIQSKYATLVNFKMETEEIREVEKVLEDKVKSRQEKESREYLRRKSKVKLVK